jgi:beta-N-acetylhexosaminidase
MTDTAIPQALSAAIYGIEGLTLTPAEIAFFKQYRPFGFILFKRNCDNPAQLKALTDALREISGWAEVPILIDQEGGRVARLREPHWRTPPAAAMIAATKNPAAAFLNARLTGLELRQMGINVNCAPLADIPVEGAHDIIGDRAYGKTAEEVIRFGQAVAEGLLAAGVLPILKHIPGHGRATVDSHEDLPIVRESLAILEASDFLPFQALRDIPLGMTAHIIYTVLDAENVATTSPAVIRYIREKIGFEGLLMSDDLSMKALRGSFREKAERTLAAGCDLILHCNGNMQEMQEVAEGVGELSAAARERAVRAWHILKPPVCKESEILALRQELHQMLTA